MSEDYSESNSEDEVTRSSELNSDIISNSDSEDDFCLYDNHSEEEVDEKGNYILPSHICSLIAPQKKKTVQVKKEPQKKKIVVTKNDTIKSCSNTKVNTAAKTIGGIWKK